MKFVFIELSDVGMDGIFQLGRQMGLSDMVYLSFQRNSLSSLILLISIAESIWWLNSMGIPFIALKNRPYIW